MPAPCSDNGRLGTRRFHNRKTPLTLLHVPCVAPCLCSISSFAVFPSRRRSRKQSTLRVPTMYLQQPSNHHAKPSNHQTPKPPKHRWNLSMQRSPARQPPAAAAWAWTRHAGSDPGRSAGMGRLCDTHPTKTRRHLLHLSARGQGTDGGPYISRASLGLSAVYVGHAKSRCCHRRACSCARCLWPWWPWCSGGGGEG